MGLSLSLLSNYFLFAALGLSSINIVVNFFFSNLIGDQAPSAVVAIWMLSVAGIIFKFVPGGRVIWLVRVLCAAAVVIGAFDVGSATSLPSFTAMIFLALAICWMRVKDDGRSLSPTMSALIPVVIVTFLSMLSGIYGVTTDSIYGPYLTMRWPNVLSFTLLAGYLLLNPPLAWPANVLASGYTSLKLSRYFLLLFSSVPVALGGLFLYGEQLGLFDARTASVYFVFSSVVMFWLIIVKGAVWAHKLNTARDLAVHRLEESWKSRESYFRGLVDDSPVILYLTGEKGECTFLSKKWEEYTGRPTIQDLGFGWLECIHPEDKARMDNVAKVEKLIRYEGYSHEFRMRRWDGQYRWVISTGIPRFDDKQQFVGYMGNVIDVHQRKIQEDSLKKDKQTAEASSQTKSQFLANMSHEIRTPLNAILGFADLCADDECVENERIDYLKRIRCNGDHLLRLIDDILDLAKVESGNALVQKSQFSIERVMDEIIGSLRALASQKGLKLELHWGADLPKMVFSDPHRIKQIVNNLVGNAIKFTAGGEVRVDVIAAGDLLSIEITDTGVGLSPSQKNNLFKPFSQADSSVTRKFGGTGLGLHLSRKLAQSIGGDVILKSSEFGQGSVFAFSFSIGTAEERRPLQSNRSRAVQPLLVMPDSPPLKKLFGKKILVAEDSADSKELIQIYFRSTGAQLIFAENGYEAISAAWREKPELILMDVQMPGLDGLEATRRLRTEGFNNPIVALTAHALQDEVDRSFEAGCNYHLTKPVMKNVLLSLVGELLEHSPPTHLHH